MRKWHTIPMNSTTVSSPYTMRFTLWPALTVAAAGSVIARTFAATSLWTDNQHTLAFQPGISGVTIEQQPSSARDPDGGLIITSAESDGSAHKAGIEAGDKIISIDGQTVASSAAFRAVIEGNSLRAIHLRVQRGFDAMAIDLPAVHPSARTITTT